MVIVNTLLTGIMAKLAKFERHVSLSDYTSTVTGKLALAQFLNTAMIVILVNAGYTGGGLGFLQVRRGIKKSGRYMKYGGRITCGRKMRGST